MKKKYTNEELRDAVDNFWETYSDLRAEEMSEYAATSVAFDNFKEKLGWEWGDKDGDKS